jgi:hypothetical protein
MNEQIKELMNQTGVPVSMPFDKWCEKFAELVRADEREMCAMLVEADGLARGAEGLVLIKAAGRILARGEKPPVKTYAGGKPNYCTPEETRDNSSWVGLTEEEIFQAYKPEMEGMPFNKPTLAVIAGYIEAKLKEKNT